MYNVRKLRKFVFYSFLNFTIIAFASDKFKACVNLSERQGELK